MGCREKFFYFIFNIFGSEQHLFLFLRNLKEKSSSSLVGNGGRGGVQRKVELVQESRIGHHFIF